ncbi:hypothetical protein GF402_04865 [Candidatus Fermentibacteria bacterium]|nr:hypothetical protein [Candidatus Fermentibacteria bacterium]
MFDKIKRFAGKILTLAILVSIVIYVYSNVEELRDAEFDLRIEYVCLSFLFASLGHLLNMLTWYRLAHSYGLKADLVTTARAWILSRLGRYVPGKVVLLIVRMNLYKGMSKKSVGMATVTEYLSSLAAAGIVLSAAIVTYPGKSPLYYPAAVITGVVLLAIALHPKVLQRFANKLLQLAKRRPIEEYPPYTKILGYVAAYLLPIAAHGLGFFFLLNALQEVSGRYILTLTGIYYASSLIGMAAVFAPSGIGIREGILFLILPQIIPKPLVIVGAVSIRLVVTAAELLQAGVFSLFARMRGRDSVKSIASESPE